MQVNNWDFEGLMHKDVRDIEFAKSLRRLGSIRVMEWDFADVFPAVNKLANQEVDIVNIVRRVADYKVMEWDFRSHPPSKSNPVRLSPDEMQALMVRLKDFLQYTVVNLIAEPKHAQIRVMEIAPNVIRFKLVLLKSDVSMLIGMGGRNAGAIRNLLKAAAGKSGVAVLLQILSHQEDMMSESESPEDE